MLSPSTGKTDRIEKMPVYASNGVEYLWLVDPLAKTMETYTLSGGQWTLTGSFKDDDKVSIVPFDAVELELSELWVVQV